jgi:hypothetical protein
LALTAVLALLPGTVLAQQGIIEGMRVILDSTFSTVSTTTTQASGTTRTTTNTLYPRVIFNVDTLVYPSLSLTAGGVFEVNAASLTTNGADTTSTATRIRPYFQLRSTNPTFSPGIGYFRRESRDRATGTLGRTLVSEDYAAYLGWKPSGLPQSDFQFLRTNTFDDKRLFLDTSKDYGSLVSRYSFRNLGVNYRGAYLGTKDRFSSLDIRQWSNAARLDYSTAFFKKRLVWNATYNVSRLDVTTISSVAGGEVALPVVPFAGLALLSDTPTNVALFQNPLLVDGNLTAGAGVNLGLLPLGANSPARNLGVDFLNPAEISRLWIWVDRELPFEVATSFTWEIYSSTDNVSWRRETTVSAAPFGPFENRFQIDFPPVSARYLKVVTRPLSPAVLDASRFPDILVTEIQPFLRKRAAEARTTQALTTQILNTDVRLRILNTPSLFYEGSYWYTGDPSSGQMRDTLSNGLSMTHRFARVFSVFGRGAVEQGRQPEGYRSAALGNATLTFEPIHTLRGTLAYSGQQERTDRLSNTRNGIFLQANAQLYRGIDFQVGGGWNFATGERGEESIDRILNVSAVVAPRPNLSVTMSYAGTTTTRSAPFAGSPSPTPVDRRDRRENGLDEAKQKEAPVERADLGRSSERVSRTRRGYLTVAFDPTRSLRLVAGEEVVTGLGEKTMTAHNIGANWTPFPDGTLQFFFAYNETVRSLDYGKERALRPGVRWRVSRGSYIDIAYQRTRTEFVFQKTETRGLTVDVKLFF